MEDRRVLATIDLGTLGAGGVAIFGAGASDQSGFSVSDAGDVNGDGYGDFLIGARGAGAANNEKLQAGETYLLFGGPSMPTTIDLNAIGSAGVVIYGADADDRSGGAVSRAGDINGDGFGDLLIGSQLADALGNAKLNAGEAYVVFGAVSLPSTIDLAALGTTGITIFGRDSGDAAGLSVSGAGDVNGDGFDDIAIGARDADAAGNAKSNAGEAYLVFGGSTLPSTIDLASLGTAGVALFGADPSDNTGISISGIGDFNGDGFDDVVIGAHYADAASNSKEQAGESYVVFGRRQFPATIDLNDFVSHGILIWGAGGANRSGISVSGAGDVNGDGLDDLIVGASNVGILPNALPGTGASYIVFGRTSGSNIDLAILGAGGIFIGGDDNGDASGRSVSHAGDVNGDGFDDVIIGAPYADAPSDSGESYVVFGGASLPSTIDLASLGAAGILLLGVDGSDYAGRSVSTAGDVNGDGFDDLLVGAGQADSVGNGRFNAGESYIIFGGNGFTSSVTHPGTTAGETLTGNSNANIMVGGRGNDLILGNSGADVLIGGQGNDTLVLTDLNFRRVVGGSGFDTLRFDVAGLTLDATTFPDNRLLGLETIDITGSGNNTLVVTRRDVLRVSDQTNTIAVRGNAGDQVHLEMGWTQFPNQVIGADTFQIFLNGQAALRVLVGVTVRTTLIDLADSTSAKTTLFGVDGDDRSGRAVGNAGDVNGDGYDDFVIGAPSADASGNVKSAAGESYVVFGGPSFPSTIDLANLGSAGFTIFGADSIDDSGVSVRGIGDMNGDGFGDLAIGAARADAAGNAKGDAGETYIVFGRLSFPATIDLAIAGSANVTIFGVDSNDRGGSVVGAAGDVNGDGFDDLVIGARYADGPSNAKNGAGEAYVVFGNASPPATIDLAALGTAGVTFFGVDAGDRMGYSVSSAGDVDGNGFDDIVFGARYAASVGNGRTTAGETRLIFGGANLPNTVDLAQSSSAVRQIVVSGAVSGDQSGTSVSGVGDVNGDGFDDFLIGARLVDGPAGFQAGAAYLIFGGSSLSANDIDLASLGTKGVIIQGVELDSVFGASVSGAGDINGDGFDDLLIGANLADGLNNLKASSGESYIVFGGPSLPQTIEAANLGGLGIAIFGVDSFDSSGIAVSRAGDVNGDGFDDWLIGAHLANGIDNAEVDAGETYLILGGNFFTNSATHLGTVNAETLTGSGSANIMNGGRGNDTLIGAGGADVLIGGLGNDVLAVSDLNFRRVVGGNSQDTLRLDGSGLTLDLTTRPDNRIQGIETIDLTGTGNNTLALTRRDVLRISDQTNALFVRGNVGDRLNIELGWTQFPNQVIGADTYQIFLNGSAVLRVLVGVTVRTTIVDLSRMGSGGTTIFGTETNDQSGFSVKGAGDVNGDGYDDVVIGARNGDAFGNAKGDAGECYVVFGGPSMPTTIDLAALGSAGFIVFGAEAGDSAGISVSSAGDVNGDGFDDLFFGAANADASGNAKLGAGDSYIVFGAASFPSPIDLSALGTSGVTIFGADASDSSGTSLSDAGDINGDGFDDIIIGAPNADGAANAKSNAGESYVVFGGASLLTTINLASLGAAGITIFGADIDDESGVSVSGAGDVNGDGFDDLVIGSSRADASGNAKLQAGESYIVFGAPSLPATIDLAALGSAGVTIFGVDPEDRSGRSVSAAGDINGDGFDDVIIGAYNASGVGNAELQAGESHVVFGGPSLPTTINLATLGAAGITVFGVAPGDNGGSAVGRAGDINGDGFDDLIIGSPSGDSFNGSRVDVGNSHVVFGGPSLPTTIDPTNLGNAGLAIFGIDDFDNSGRPVSSAGDVNGDGFGDLILGAFRGDAAGNLKASAGESYIVFGSDGFTLSATQLGTVNTETLTGNASANVMIGGRGNDTLLGSGGADVLLGGQGNDLLAVSDVSFRRVVGGSGQDALRLDGAGLTLNLNTRSDNRILGIETIDITGSGDNTLLLSRTDVLNISDQTNALFVRGNAGDTVGIDSGWSQFPNQVIGADTYQIFLNGSAVLRVLVGVTVRNTFINLSSSAASRTTIFGAEAGDNSGYSVSNVGDVNGDGFDDVAIGARDADAGSNLKSSAGDTYIVFGGATMPTSIDIASLGTAGIAIFGADINDKSGISIAGAGDINGDGFGDILIGANAADASGNAKADAGESYIVFGGAALPASINLASLGALGMTIFGADAGDGAGASVSPAGDFDGDGFDDLIIGAPGGDGSSNAKVSAGDSYIITGGTVMPATIDLSAPVINGIKIFGAEISDRSGISVSTAGDVNGDGFDDVVIGAYLADASGNAKSSAGDSYIVFGRPGGASTIDLNTLGAQGVVLFGAGVSDASGRSVSNAGDVNGDGFDDLLIGARYGDGVANGRLQSGESYLIFGKASFSATIDLAALGANGITIVGSETNDWSGFSVSAAGDINGDGLDDIIIGARDADGVNNTRSNAGESYVVFGSTSLPATIDLANFGNTFTLGLAIFGIDPNDASGASVSSAGDVNGDGFDDLIIGAFQADSINNGRVDAGESYIIFGGNGFTSSVTNLGTSVAETLTGSASANIMVAGRGNDTLLGAGGSDVPIGGQGSDILTINDVGFRRIVGGTGQDTLRLNGSGLNLNLPAIRDNRILGIETIDLTGTGNNTLSINRFETLNISHQTNALFVRGNAGDIVNIESGWAQFANQVINAETYQIFVNSSAALRVLVGVTVQQTLAPSAPQLASGEGPSPAIPATPPIPWNSPTKSTAVALPLYLKPINATATTMQTANGRRSASTDRNVFGPTPPVTPKTTMNAQAVSTQLTENIDKYFASL